MTPAITPELRERAGKDRFDLTPERLLKLARHLFLKTDGKGWEPPDPRHPLIVGLIEAGFIRRVDGICGFERLKDACVTWTDAGRAAAAPPPASPLATGEAASRKVLSGQKAFLSTLQGQSANGEATKREPAKRFAEAVTPSSGLIPHGKRDGGGA